ncbi:dienelactone hydrolase family protein [Streptomyces sp. NPDC053728]|uniref:dienelactone hydrolase family protein n=1 Tax=Streptomyces sp. NPDC053728 TaxID=3155534 RepID=UPI0034237606
MSCSPQPDTSTTTGERMRTEVYPGAVHGFTMADTDAFDPGALRRHWDRLLPLLDSALSRI